MYKTKVIYGVNDLETQKPKLSNEWNYEKNGMFPRDIYFRTTKKYWWKCSFCGKDFEDVVAKREHPGCKECRIVNRGKARTEKNIQKNGSLQDDQYKDLLLDWDYVKNIFLPKEISPNSNKKIAWTCHVCGYNWNTSPAHRVSGTGCPARANRVVYTGHNDLKTLYPELTQEWSEKNEADASEILASTTKIYWWKCSICGTEWQTSAHNRIAGTNCPKCINNNTSFGEQTVYYYVSKYCDGEVVNRWIDPVTKKEIDVYIPNKKIGIEFDGYRFHKKKELDDDKKTTALKKSGIKLIRIREKQYNGDALPELTVKPYKVYSFSPKNRYQQLDHIVVDIIKDDLKLDIDSEEVDSFNDRFRILRDTNQRAKEVSFLESGSEHLKFWDYEKNEPLKPENFSPQSGIQVNWICNVCGERWVRSIHAQTKTKGCPNCNKTAATKRYNLTTEYPELIDEWCWEMNSFEPSTLMPNSHKKCWWKCKKCGKTYLATVAHRVNGTSCKECGRKESDKKRMKKVLQLNEEGEVIAEFASAREATEKTGINYKHISSCCNNKRKTTGGYRWQFADEKLQ